MATLPEAWREYEMLYRQALGVKVRRLRKEMGLNQDDFADLAYLHRSHIGLIENAKYNISLATLLRLAKALNVAPEELIALNGEGPERP